MAKSPKTSRGWEKQIDRIIQGIGSPYGEGATYSPRSFPTHLDEHDAPVLAKDLHDLVNSALSHQRTSLIGEIQKMRKMAIIPKEIPIEEDMTTVEGIIKHEYKLSQSRMAALIFEKGWNQALDDILSILQEKG